MRTLWIITIASFACAPTEGPNASLADLASAQAPRAGNTVASGGSSSSIAKPLWAEVGGSNHSILSAGDYLTTQSDAAWYGPNGIKPVLGAYHQFPGKGRAQLHAMRLAGQRKVALVLWSMNFGATVTGDVFGHVVRSNSARLTPQHEENFKAWVADVRAEGFDEIQLRFASQGPSDPMGWSAWNEKLYQETWNFMVSTRATLESSLAGTTVSRRYDLGGEYGGLVETGQNRAYTKRLWTDWVHTFGVANTVGFSFATYPGRLRKMIEVYDETGTRPNEWAFDTYDEVEVRMREVAKEFAVAGIKNPSIYIQETYADDESTAKAWVNIASTTDLRIRTLMQWPVKPNKTARHFSMDFSESYAAYLRARENTPSPVLARSGVGCADRECIWLIGTEVPKQAHVVLRTAEGALLQDEATPSTEQRGNGETLMTLRVTSAAAAFRTTGVLVTIVDAAGRASNAQKVTKQ
jgi:hypothetical protein